MTSISIGNREFQLADINNAIDVLDAMERDLQNEVEGSEYALTRSQLVQRRKNVLAAHSTLIHWYLARQKK